MKILYIEDDHVDQIALERMVRDEQLPYLLITVNSVSQAQELLQSEPFDVILADYLIGSGTAFDVLPIVRDTPVIFITGYGSEDVAARAMKAGAYDYVIKDPDRNYLKILPIVMDNTIARHLSEIQAREAAAERLRREILNQFVQDASHDLRTALTSLDTTIYLLNQHIVRMVEMMAHSPSELENQIAVVQTYGRNVYHRNQHLQHLILDMLKMVTLDTLDSLPLERCDVNILMEDALVLHQSEAATRHISLLFMPTPNPLRINVSPNDIGEIFYQILKNAVTFTPPGGSITLSAYEENQWVIIEFEDTGIGISSEELTKIFQRFYRGDKARKINQGSSGMGLAIARRLVELHHGHIEVISQMGEGSRFRIFLPKAG